MVVRRCVRALVGPALSAGLLFSAAQGRAADPAETAAPEIPLPSVSADLFAQPAAPPAANPTPPSPAPASSAPGTGFGPPPSSRVLAFSGSNPRMIGDFLGGFGLGTTTPSFVSGSSSSSSSSASTFSRVPLAGGGFFKISENQSPAPEDRVFVAFNYYNDVQGPTIMPVGVTRPIPPMTITFPGFPPLFPPTTITTPGFPSRVVHFPPSAPKKLDVFHELVGVEKTFLDGRASIQLQQPFNETTEDLGKGQDGDGFGDLTAILKYAAYQDQDAGDVVSVGLAVTFPTGLETRVAVPPPFIGDPTTTAVVHPYQFEPFVGYVWNAGDFYVEGFSSVSLPTDHRDVILMFNDVGVGYHAYRNDGDDAFLRSITPTLEAHINTPLNHSNPLDLITVPNSVDLTEGVHLGLGENATLTLGVAEPVTGPKPFAVESVVQLNWKF